MILQDKVIAKIKEYFPNIEVQTIAEPEEFSISYGLAEGNALSTEYEYVHKLMTLDEFCSMRKAQVSELGRAIDYLTGEGLGEYVDIKILQSLNDNLTISLNNDLAMLGEKL